MKVVLALFVLVALTYAQVSPLFILGTLEFDPLKHKNGLPVDLLKIDVLTNTTTSAFNFFLPANDTLLDIYLVGTAFDQNEDIYYFVVNTVVGEKVESSLYAIDCFNYAFAFQNVTLNGPVFWDISINSKGEIFYLTQSSFGSKAVNLNRWNPKTTKSHILLQEVALAHKFGSTAYIESAETMLVMPASVENPPYPVVTIGPDYTTTQIPMDTNTIFSQGNIACSNFTDSCILIQTPFVESSPHYSSRIVNYIPLTNEYQLICPVTEKSTGFGFSTFLNGNSAFDEPNNVVSFVLNTASGNAGPTDDVAILFMDLDTCSESWVLQPHGDLLLYFGPEFAWSLPL